MKKNPGPEEEGGRIRITTRGRVASVARRVVAGATDRRFDTVETMAAQLSDRVAEVERALADGLSELRALRQQVDECLAFLRVDHDVLRDLLEELTPSLGRETRSRNDANSPASGSSSS